MTDDVLFVPDFADYRILEAQKGAKLIHQMIQEKVTPEFFNGAMRMLKGIINVPKQMKQKRRPMI
jgi:hypothetical protein